MLHRWKSLTARCVEMCYRQAAENFLEPSGQKYPFPAMWQRHIYKCVLAQCAEMCIWQCDKDTFTGVTKSTVG